MISSWISVESLSSSSQPGTKSKEWPRTFKQWGSARGENKRFGLQNLWLKVFQFLLKLKCRKSEEEAGLAKSLSNCRIIRGQKKMYWLILEIFVSNIVHLALVCSSINELCSGCRKNTLGTSTIISKSITITRKSFLVKTKQTQKHKGALSSIGDRKKEKL